MRSFIFFLLGSAFGIAAPSLKIQGSTTVNPIVVDAADRFQKLGWRVVVDTQGGSSGGISALGEGLVDIGMVSKPITEKDRTRFPKTNFVETVLGADGVAMVVSKSLFDAGVTHISKGQLLDVYEGKVRSWKELGGPDLPIVFFNKEPGRGTWEVFAQYLYGGADKAPAVSHPEVGGNEEGRTKVASHKSAMTQLSASWAVDGVRVLGLIGSDGREVLPTKENVKSGTYPMRRSLALITNGPPKGAAREFIDYLLSGEGQKLLSKHGYLPK